ncbi:MAG: LLM class flavin-dependent oxidoreductase [Micrococcus sp.]|nr:LLM class flavin-dependent oxidoreductase [Micrococcus sp.]
MDGIVLFRHAESLGYASGWVRVHRHERTLSAPFAFLVAAARETSRIGLGTGGSPIAGEDPGKLAEQAATGQPAPAPAVVTEAKGARPAPPFVEWLMGLDEGWLTSQRQV